MTAISSCWSVLPLITELQLCVIVSVNINRSAYLLN